MKNYKQALFNAINDSTTEPKEYLSGYSKDFITDHDADSSQYICDAITDFADSHTSIYYYDIKKFIIDNFDAVENAINEYGWDGCGGDLYKAGQLAEFSSIEQEIYEDLENIIKYITLDFIDSTDEASTLAENIWANLTEERKTELLDDFICDLENIDNNSRLDEISDLYTDFVNKIIESEDNG